jgi:phytanoyl-CoA hydroxylase
MLTEAQLEEFNDKGFLAIPDFASADEISSLQNSGLALLDTFDPESISIFSTKNQTKKTDQYFLDSANNVSFFFEEGAFDDDGNLLRPKNLSINKIGHAMHDLVPEFRSWTRNNPKLAALLRSLGYRRPLPVQSMFIFKQPGIGGEVVPHQDSSFLATEPLTVTGLWLALEDATLENGCLWALPGSHKHGIYKKFIRNLEDNTVSFSGGELPPEVLEDNENNNNNNSKFEPVEVKAGTLVLLHGANLHKSKENKSGKSRHAFTVHYVEGAKGVEYSKTNWLQRKENFPFEPLYDDSDLHGGGAKVE